MRRPRLHIPFKIDPDKGLSDYLSGKKEFNELVMETQVDNLYIMPSGPYLSNPSELLSSTKMKDFLKDASERFDFILYDTPPIAVITDAVILASVVDGTIIVVESGKTLNKVLPSIASILKNAGSQVIGTIPKQDHPKTNSDYYVYSHYYGDKRRKR